VRGPHTSRSAGRREEERAEEKGRGGEGIGGERKRVEGTSMSIFKISFQIAYGSIKTSFSVNRHQRNIFSKRFIPHVLLS